VQPIGFVYALIDPLTKAVRYIGMTRKTPQVRLALHQKRARAGEQYHVSTWLRSLPSMTPEILVLEEASADALASRERYWIKHYRAQGADLCNHTDGGEGQPGLRHSAETRKRMSASHMGKRPTPEQRQRQSEAAKKRWASVSAEDRKKAMSHLSGRPVSQAQRDAVAASNRRRAKRQIP
jgi:hypothetical protein